MISPYGFLLDMNIPAVISSKARMVPKSGAPVFSIVTVAADTPGVTGVSGSSRIIPGSMAAYMVRVSFL